MERHGRKDCDYPNKVVRVDQGKYGQLTFSQLKLLHISADIEI